MEESEAARLQQVANLEAELQSLKATLLTKEEEIASLKEEVESKVGVFYKIANEMRQEKTGLRDSK